MDKIYFTKEMMSFYDNLKKNNNKEWFTQNRYIYDNIILPQAKEYVIDMGAKLQQLDKSIISLPQIDGSIFRIYKDVRINKGKAPFKTHLGIIFYSGIKRLESPCFYLHIEPPFYYTGVGIPRFNQDILYSYRQLVNNNKYTDILNNIKNTAEKNYFNIEGDKLKNIPKHMEAVNETAAYFLKFKTIRINDEMPLNNDFYSSNLLNHTYNIFEKLLPFFNFLKTVVNHKIEQSITL